MHRHDTAKTRWRQGFRHGYLLGVAVGIFLGLGMGFTLRDMLPDTTAHVLSLTSGVVLD